MRTVDARGLRCPMPLVMAKVAMEKVEPGDGIVVLATDSEASIDLAAWAADEDHTLVERAADGWTELVLTPRRGPTRPGENRHRP